MYLSKLYGCVIASDVDLHQAPLAEGPSPDVTLRQADDEWDPGWKPELADVISDYWNEPIQQGYVSARIAEGYRLRLHDYCEYDLNRELDCATWRVAPNPESWVVATVAVGAFMTLRLMLQGDLVLHSSAVTVGGRGLAFVGMSGMGKSTMASLMCHAGALHVTDDVGRVLFAKDGVKLASGGHESRLRTTAAPVADLMPEVGTRRTDDGRLALSLARTPAETVPLDAVVIPLPTRDRTELTLHTRSPAETVLLLNGFPRLAGLQDPAMLDRQFHQLVDLAERVPVFTAAIPWGPTYQPAVATELIRQLGWGPPARLSARRRTDRQYLGDMPYGTPVELLANLRSTAPSAATRIGVTPCASTPRPS